MAAAEERKLSANATIAASLDNGAHPAIRLHRAPEIVQSQIASLVVIFQLRSRTLYAGDMLRKVFVDSRSALLLPNA
jgi:hypothetical protein